MKKSEINKAVESLQHWFDSGNYQYSSPNLTVEEYQTLLSCAKHFDELYQQNKQLKQENESLQQRLGERTFRQTVFPEQSAHHLQVLQRALQLDGVRLEKESIYVDESTNTITAWDSKGIDYVMTADEGMTEEHFQDMLYLQSPQDGEEIIDRDRFIKCLQSIHMEQRPNLPLNDLRAVILFRGEEDFMAAIRDLATKYPGMTDFYTYEDVEDYVGKYLGAYQIICINVGRIEQEYLDVAPEGIEAEIIKTLYHEIGHFEVATDFFGNYRIPEDQEEEFSEELAQKAYNAREYGSIMTDDFYCYEQEFYESLLRG